MTSTDLKMTAIDLKETSTESVKPNRKNKIRRGNPNYNDNATQRSNLMEQIFSSN